MTEKEQVSNTALDVVTFGNVTTRLFPALFTSCCKAQAESFVSSNKGYALIHSTPAGKDLENLGLFNHMSSKLAYLHWFYLSSRFVVENEFPDEVVFVGDPNNTSSTAFGIEIPLLYFSKPNVQSIFNPLTGTRTARKDWHAENLVRSYFVEMLNLWTHGSSPYELDKKDTTLLKKFNETPDTLPEDSLEAGLKMMIAGYLSEHSGFPPCPRRNSPYGISLDARR